MGTFEYYLLIDLGKAHTHSIVERFIHVLEEKLIKIYTFDIEEIKKVFSESKHEVNLTPKAYIALVIQCQNTIYFVTSGEIAIYIKRDNYTVLLLEGTNFATGVPLAGDIFVISTKQFREFMGSEDDFKKVMNRQRPQELIQVIENDNDNTFHHGSALFLEYPGGTQVIKTEVVVVDTAQSVEERSSLYQDDDSFIKDQYPRVQEEDITHVEKEVDQDSFINDQVVNVPTVKEMKIQEEHKEMTPNKIVHLILPYKTKLIALLKMKGSSQKKRKFITISVIVVLSVILVYSVILGNQRRHDAEAQKRVESVKVLVEKKLGEAGDTVFINLPKAMELIDEAKTEVNKLEISAEEKYKPQINEIHKLIVDKESRIIKKEDKTSEEFFDLSIDDKKAKGSAIYLSADLMAIMDSENGRIYLLSLEKKSFEKIGVPEVKSAQKIVQFKDFIYVFSQTSGVYKINNKGKAVEVIKADSSWGKIVDLEVYNGNIYMLDVNTNDIYKYVAVESGFANKTSYFGSGSGVNLSNGNSLSIDSSVYIGLENNVLKYAGGAPETFGMKLPKKDFSINKIYTNKDVSNIFVWDKKNSSVYVISKDGQYQKAIQSSSFAKASDIVVYNGAIYTIEGSKIYKVTVE